MGIAWAVGHAYRRKVQQPRRLRQWKTKQRPFEHRAAGDLTFRLYPGEFIDRHIFVEGIYEQRFLDFVRSYYELHPGTVALDVGSNIGNHALYLSKCFRQIHCFDPNPVALQRLRENARLSGSTNLVIHPVALSNAAGELPFVVVSDGNLGASHFTDDPDKATMTVPRVVGDDYIAGQLQALDFIKVDVENHEPEVFEGLQQTIAKYRPTIAFEYHGEELPLEHFVRIAAVLPGYIFAEATHARAEESTWSKLVRQLAHRDRPTLERFAMPEQRLYENILAFPDEGTFERFKQLSAQI
jgi:FkbM family methyltransferase